MVSKELDTLFGYAEKLNRQHRLNFERGLIELGDNVGTQKYFSASLITMPYAVMTYVAFPDGQFYGARRMADQSIEVVKNNASTGGDSHYFTINSRGESVKATNIYKNFDPRIRPWYQKAVATKELSFTDMYSHFVLKDPTITASLPIYLTPNQEPSTNSTLAEGELVAVFAVDFLTTWLTETLKALPIGENGHVIIVDQKNQLVSSTTGEPLFEVVDNVSKNLALSQSSHPVTKGISTLIAQSALNRVALDIDGEQYFVSMSQYKHFGFNWHIYTAIAAKNYYKLFIIPGKKTPTS